MASTRNLEQLNTIADACSADCGTADTNGDYLDTLTMLAETGQLSAGNGSIKIDTTLDEESVNAIQNKAVARLIPAEANSANRLADKKYVSDKIAEAGENYVEKEDGKGLSSCDFTLEDAEYLNSLENYDDSELRNQIINKVDKVEGKGLSTNDFTNEYKTKLDELTSPDTNNLQSLIASKADVNHTHDEYLVLSDIDGKVDKIEGKGLSTNDYTDEEKAKVEALDTFGETFNNQLANKVDKSEGKGLSTNDYTTEEKEKLASLSNFNDAALRDLIAGKADATHSHTEYVERVELDRKVDKVDGKGLSTNDYTDEEKAKIESLDLQKIESDIDILDGAIDKNFFKVNATRMIAHRGRSDIAPGNTLPAYELAGDFGYWGGEVDIQKTKDGHFICIHDGTLDRETSGTGNVADFTLAEIKELHTPELTPFMGNAENLPIVSGEAAIRVPTLEEYLEVCKRRNLVPVIELKEETLTTDDMPSLLAIVDKWQMSERVIYIAFNEHNTNLLETIHDLNPKAHCQPLLAFTEENIDYVAETFAPNCGIDVYYGNVTKELIEYAHSKGVEVNCWTVDDEYYKEKFFGWGIDYITTNKLLNPHLPEMKTGALDYELGGFERTVDALQKTFELQSDTLSHIIFCENPVRGSHNLFDPSTIEQSEAGTTPYSRAILTYFNENNTDYSRIRAIDKTKYYLNEKTVYVGGIDYNTYKVTLIPFNEKGLFITDLGWFTARCFVALPDRTSFVLFYFARVDDGDITDTDLNALKSCYISKSQPRRYVIPNSDFTFVTKLNDNLSALGKTELSLSEMTAGFISSEPTNRCWSFKGENVQDYTKIKFHYSNTDYVALAYCFKKNSAGKLVYTEDLDWAEDGIELKMPSKTERIYFAFKKADGSTMTRKDLTSIHNCVVVEIY